MSDFKPKPRFATVDERPFHERFQSYIVTSTNNIVWTAGSAFFQPPGPQFEGIMITKTAGECLALIRHAAHGKTSTKMVCELPYTVGAFPVKRSDSIEIRTVVTPFAFIRTRFPEEYVNWCPTSPTLEHSRVNHSPPAFCARCSMRLPF